MRFIAMTILTIMFATVNAMACTCAGGINIDDYTKKVDVIFVGTVISVKHDIITRPYADSEIRAPGTISITLPGTIYITFKVTNSIKGSKVGATLVVDTPDQGPACGIEQWATAKPGSIWSVYSYRLEGGRLVTSHCDRTRLVK